MYTYQGKYLTDIINNMTDDARYQLLATLRTGEKLSNKTQQLRWYFMRGIVIRAYKKRAHYFIGRVNDWWDCSFPRMKAGTKPSMNYYSEVGHILTLAEFIRDYKQDSSVPDHHIVAVKKALKAYYLKFGVLETQAYLVEKGVSFTTKNRNGKMVPVMVREVAHYDYLLVHNEFDLVKALQQWERQHTEKYEKWLRGETKAKYVYPVTPARALNMYSNLIRHLTARTVAICPTFTEICSEHPHDNEDITIDDLGYEMKDSLTACRDVAAYIDKLHMQARYVNQKIYQGR